jgi:hypothetical protein
MQDHRAANSGSKWGWKVHASGSPIQELIQVKQVAHMVESGLIEKPSPSFLVLLGPVDIRSPVPLLEFYFEPCEEPGA